MFGWKSNSADPRPESAVSGGVGVAGLIGLAAWIMIARQYGMDGPYSALAACAACGLPMVIWSLLKDKVHLRESTGIDWNSPKPLKQTFDTSVIKLAGLWGTWGLIAVIYCIGRWYWTGQYQFSMEVMETVAPWLLATSIPYVMFLDRFMVEPKDSTWHFGAMLLGRGEWDTDAIKKHWRAWIIKAFFGAFMISILPPGFAYIVESDPASIIANPVELGMLLITLLFVVDVQIGTVGYLFTLRPLDAHIRSGNPFVAGWLAALLCYPPFVWGIIGSNNQILSYESNVLGWGDWFAGNTALLWVWAVWLVFLTAIYAWATVVFGIRFSNLTYRGILTNGPYRFTRHPAYLSKNLFWWCSVMPFLVTSGSPVDAIRNTFFLLMVNAIYYWRARTEERHLLAEDAKYREYYDWMEQYGLVTAPLARIKRRLTARFAGQPAHSQTGPGADPAQEPAE